MKPAVLSPPIASRLRCSIGSRTSACTPLMKARPFSRLYLSSSETVSSALRIDSGRGAFIGGELQRDRLGVVREFRVSCSTSLFFQCPKTECFSNNLAANHHEDIE